MENKIIIAPGGEVDENFKKAGKEMQALNEEVLLQAKKDLVEIDSWIKETEEHILLQKEYIELLEGSVDLGLESKESILGKISDQKIFLQRLEDDLADSVLFKNRLLEIMTETSLSEIEVSAKLEGLETEIRDFKSKLLKIENTNN